MKCFVLNVLLLTCALFFTGCTVLTMNQAFLQRQKTAQMQKVDINIYQPERLAKINKVAILDFRVINTTGQEGMMEIYKGTPSHGQCWFLNDVAGMLLAECFEERLLAQKKFEVVERNQLKAVLHEKGIEMSGLVDTDKNKDIVGLSGVDAIILGTLANAYYYMPNKPRLPDFFSCGVRVRMIDLKTGKIILTMRDKIFECGTVDEEKSLYEIADRAITALTRECPRK